MHVLGPVDRREGVQDLDEVVIEGGVGRAAADRGLPGVPMGIDEARDDDAVARVDHLGIGADVRLDGDDLVVLDEHVRGEVPDLGIHAHDRPPANQRLSCHLPRAPLHLAWFPLVPLEGGESSYGIDDLVDGGYHLVLECVGERKRYALRGHSPNRRVE